ncbi:hypothetical protein FIBSPDRAFT_903329 [Athelia psychrophila]|uniref:Uncharacterized protein n=1 Tax=Athelia psychrophila TaxID=1759441 RepID=A0A167W5C3_9AGAM|nr:hypothetical protein FIBSPDRAFT_903329 [Fibularhizoctonia sp. CBS 109695]
MSGGTHVAQGRRSAAIEAAEAIYAGRRANAWGEEHVSVDVARTRRWPAIETTESIYAGRRAKAWREERESADVAQGRRSAAIEAPGTLYAGRRAKAWGEERLSVDEVASLPLRNMQDLGPLFVLCYRVVRDVYREVLVTGPVG